jgi:hypothetical protein
VTRTSAQPASRCRIPVWDRSSLPVDQALYCRVLIAPWRGRNVRDQTSSVGWPTVLIAPWRGRNMTVTTSWARYSVCPSSPLGGVATSRPRAARPPAPTSSSPLGGVATPGLHRRRRCWGVLIAPWRGCNRRNQPSISSVAPCPHRPLEGLQQHADLVDAGRFPRPHRPLEGSQQRQQRRGICSANASQPWAGRQQIVSRNATDCLATHHNAMVGKAAGLRRRGGG